jgi:hypothetical protein
MRDKFSDEDLRSCRSDERFLACVDAYQQDIINFPEAIRRYSGRKDGTILDLSFFGSHGLALAIGQQIRSGEIEIPSEFRMKFADCYLPMPSREGLI